MVTTDFPRVVIVGAGISGLCLAIRLKRAGFDNFTILEKSDEVGGTWLENSYPNAGCDIPSHLYSFSFAPNDDWSTKYARQPEILAYLKSCADRFDLRSHIRFETSVVSAKWNEGTGTWSISTNGGDDFVADVFVTAVGQLNRPHIPSIEGLDTFRYPYWHSARWNHDFDFVGKTVAVIGNGASAIQFLPEVASRAKKIYLVQRTASWVQPFDNYRYPLWAKRAFRWIPFIARMHRLWIYLALEMRILAFRKGSWVNHEYEKRLRRQMRRKLPSEKWPQMIPDYAPGCKRILLSNDYVQTLERENVEVISEPLERIDEGAIETASGTHRVDAVIFATGFKSTEFLQPIEIRGRDGQSINEAWGGRPKALYGMSTRGFPNMFMLYGPNTNLGHNSIVFMVERQVNYILRCLRRMRKTNSRMMEVKQKALDDFDADVQSRLQSSVWSGGCTNWYKSADGSIPNNWWGSATAFWMRVRRPKFSDFEFKDG